MDGRDVELDAGHAPGNRTRWLRGQTTPPPRPCPLGWIWGYEKRTADAHHRFREAIVAWRSRPTASAGDGFHSSNHRPTVVGGFWGFRTGHYYKLYFACHTEAVRSPEHLRDTRRSDPPQKKTRNLLAAPAGGGVRGPKKSVCVLTISSSGWSNTECGTRHAACEQCSARDNTRCT